jgi:hypothetical protein
MKSIKFSLIYFLLAYITASIISLAAYRINITVMQIILFTLIPAIFGYFFYLYLKKTKCDSRKSFKETNLLIVFWIIASLSLDGLVYIVIVPLLYGYNPRWIFFTDHSFSGFLNYAMLIIVGYIARFFYLKKERLFRK